MNKVWELFENLNEYVYVSDMDTHDLIYMNRKLRETYGFADSDGYAGKKCYELLHNCSVICATCNNAELEPGQFAEWQCYNPILEKYLSNKATVLEEDGRRYRMEIAIDISVQGHRDRVLHDDRYMELIVYEGIRMAMQADSPDKSIDIVLEYLGKSLEGERTYIFEKNAVGGDDNTYEWVADGITAEKDNLQNLTPEYCAHWYEDFNEDKSIMVEDVENIRDSQPLLYGILKSQGISSLVVVPLYDDGKVFGFYGVDNPPRKALDYASSMLQIMGCFIVLFIKRREMMNRLNHMSLHDQLTGLGNRYAMEEYIDSVEPGSSLGIVYCDVTGLKHINDTKGHRIGDSLIVKSCECLRRQFDGYGLFRIGGDELLAICSNINEDTFNKKIIELKRDTEANDVALAVGYAWSGDEKERIDRMISRAEALMYEDKADYYVRTGTDRRRK